MNPQDNPRHFDLAEQKMITVSLHPGWVKTSMTRNENAPLEAEETIGGMLKVIDSLTMEDSERIFGWRGNELPWELEQF